MILSVPFAYEVVGYEPRRQNASRDARRGVVEVWVEEVDPMDAPVAVTWRRQPDRHDEDVATIEVRRFAGGLWCSAADSPHAPHPPEGGPLRGEDMVRAVREGMLDSNPFAGFLSGMPAEGREPIAFRRESGSNRDAVEAAVRTRASELVAIDGELFLVCPEPVFALSRGHVERASEAVSVRWYEPWLHGHGSRGGVYRLDEWDHLLRDARRETGGRTRFDLPAEHPGVALADPSALTLPLEGSALAERALELLSEMGSYLSDQAESASFGRHYGGRDRGGAGRDRLDWRAPFDLRIPAPGVAEAYARLSAILSAGMRDDGDVEALRVVAGTPLPGRGRYDGLDQVRRAAAALSDSLVRWDARPDRMREAAPDPDDAVAFAEPGLSR